MKVKVLLNLLSAKMATANIPEVFFANSSHREGKEPSFIFQKTFCTYCALIVVIAIPAQSFVIRAILRREQLKTPIHRLLLQIAIIDLIAAVWNSCYFWLLYFGNEFFAWSYSCNFFQYPIYVVDTAGIFFCAFIGFMLFTRHLTNAYVNVISCAIWIISILAMSDLAYNKAYRKYWNEEVYRCLTEVGNFFNLELVKETLRLAVAVCIMVVLPLLSKVVRGRFWVHTENNEMLLQMVLWQITFTTGTALAVTKMNLHNDHSDPKNLLYYDQYLVMLSTVYRPVLYVFFCRHFRNEFKEMRVTALVQPETLSLQNGEGART